MDEHIHTGFITFVVVGVYAILFFNLVRLASAKMVEYAPTATVGKALGAAVHFG